MTIPLPNVVVTGEDTLTRRRRAAQNQLTNAPFRIVLVDDDPAILRLLSRLFGSKGMEVIPCSTGAEAFEALEQVQWQLCILDRGLPDIDGIEICQHIKADPRFDASQVIMLSAYTSLEARVEALERGADDYITKPFQPAELLARVNASRRVVEIQNQLVDMARQLEELSARDGLTGIFNRRHFATTLDHAFDHSSRYQRPLSVAIIDVDRFKSINDTFGHQAGDAVLAEVARRFSGSVRSSDYLARYGGEEFVVILPETQLDDAITFGEKLRLAVAAAPVTIDGRELPVTVSVGAASLAHTQFISSSAMVAAADEALYRAKRNGRNRVEAERRRALRAIKADASAASSRRSHSQRVSIAAI